MHRGLELHPRTCSSIPRPLFSLSTISLSHHFFLPLSVSSVHLFLHEGRMREKELTEEMLYIESGRVNEYLMLFPPFLSTVPFTNMHFLSFLSVGITSPVITPFPPAFPLSPSMYLSLPQSSFGPWNSLTHQADGFPREGERRMKPRW